MAKTGISPAVPDFFDKKLSLMIVPTYSEIFNNFHLFLADKCAVQSHNLSIIFSVSTSGACESTSGTMVKCSKKLNHIL